MYLRFYWAFLLFFEYITGEGISKQDYYWRDYTFSTIPCDAFEGAPEKYIGIGDYHGNWPLTIYPYSKLAALASNQKHVISFGVKIMCTANSDKFYWEFVASNANVSQQIDNAILGGRRTDQGLDLFIGKAYHEDEWKIGAVVLNDHNLRGLWIWKQNFETVKLQEFYLLKYNSSDNSCSCSVNAN